MAERQYPFPSRTRKSSSPAPMIVPSRRESRWLPGFFLSASLFCGLWPSLFCWGLCLPRRLVRNHMERFRAVPAMHAPTPAATCGVATQSLRARLIDEPKNCLRNFFNGSSILGRLPGFFCLRVFFLCHGFDACHAWSRAALRACRSFLSLAG